MDAQFFLFAFDAFQVVMRVNSRNLTLQLKLLSQVDIPHVSVNSNAGPLHYDVVYSLCIHLNILKIYFISSTRLFYTLLT